MSVDLRRFEPLGKTRKSKPLTPVELEIMKVLWEAGPATVQAVRERLPGEPRSAYTTVQTMLNVLYRKGKVRRALKGKAYRYAPALTREGATFHAMRDIIDRLFGGSAEDLVLSLVEQHQLTPERLSALNRLLDRTPSKGQDDGRD
jgi:BlaI family penicillinase repressor